MTVSDEDNGQRHFGKRMWQLRVWGCGSCEYEDVAVASMPLEANLALNFIFQNH